MTRFRAAGIHLLLSGLVAVCLLTVMFTLWYPGVYFKLMGGGLLLFIMVGVDICLGPLLTLIVFKSGKKTLKFDLTVIALLQTAALTYGGWVMFEARPAFTVFMQDQFRIASTVDIDRNELAKAKNPEWQHFSMTGPVLVAAAMPSDSKEQQDLVFLAASGIDLHQLPRLYVDYKGESGNVLKRAKPISDLRRVDSKNGEIVDKLIQKMSRPEQDFVFIPVLSSHAEMAAILDAKNADMIEILDVKAWKD